MKIRETLATITFNPDYKGRVYAENMILAVNITPEKPDTKIEDYAIFTSYIEGVDNNIETDSIEKKYLHEGKMKIKTSTQRKFKITGNRYIGDEAQDSCIAKAFNSETETDYVFFNTLTGKGEKGRCSVIVNSDGTSKAGELSEIDIEINTVGNLRTDFDASTLLIPHTSKKMEVK